MGMCIFASCKYWRELRWMFNTWPTLSIKMTAVSGSYMGPGPNVATARREIFLCGKGDANSPFSLQWCMSSLLTPSNQMSSPGEESTSPKILPCSQDLEALRLKREEKERRVLFFFLNILERNGNRMVDNEQQSPQVKTENPVKEVWWTKQHLYNSGPRSSCSLFSLLIPPKFLKFLCGSMSRTARQKTKPWVGTV